MNTDTTQQDLAQTADRAIAGPDQPAAAADRRPLIIRSNPDRLNRRGRRHQEATQRRYDRRTLRSLHRQDIAARA